VAGLAQERLVAAAHLLADALDITEGADLELNVRLPEGVDPALDLVKLLGGFGEPLRLPDLVERCAEPVDLFGGGAGRLEVEDLRVQIGEPHPGRAFLEVLQRLDDLL